MSAVDKLARQLLRTQSLSGIELTVTPRGVTARALPDHFHPAVELRRMQAFARHQGSISIDEAEAIQTKAVSDPVAVAQAPELDLALLALKKELLK